MNTDKAKTFESFLCGYLGCSRSGLQAAIIREPHKICGAGDKYAEHYHKEQHEHLRGERYNARQTDEQGEMIKDIAHGF